MNKFTSFFAVLAVLALAGVASANDYSHEAYVSPNGSEEYYHGREHRQNIGEGVGRLLGQIISAPAGIIKGMQASLAGDDGGAEYSYHRKNGSVRENYRNYPVDPRGALPSGGYRGYSPAGYGQTMYVPGSNIPLGFTPAPVSQVRANFGSRGWGVQMGY